VAVVGLCRCLCRQEITSLDPRDASDSDHIIIHITPSCETIVDTKVNVVGPCVCVLMIKWNVARINLIFSTVDDRGTNRVNFHKTESMHSYGTSRVDFVGFILIVLIFEVLKT